MRLPIIGSLDASTPAIRSEVMIAFLQRLREPGWMMCVGVLL
jgi:hypothetical protein